AAAMMMRGTGPIQPRSIARIIRSNTPNRVTAPPTHDRTLLPTPSRPNHSLSEGRVEAATAGAGSRSWGADGSVVNGSCSCSWSALLQYCVHLEFCVSDAGVLVGCGVSACVCDSSGGRCC